MRRTVALAALAGLVGTTAFGAANTLHVLFEHRAPHGTAAHSAHHPESDRLAEGHAHPRDLHLVATGHPHPDSGQMHPGEAPGHNHAPTLAAELRARSGRLSADPVSAGPAESPRSLLDPVVPSPPRPRTRASPAARAAPLARRSVVLQV